MSANKKLEFNRKQKLLKRRQQKLASYYKNRSKKNAEYTTTKHRAIKRLKNALPRTPKRRSATLAAYLQHTKSPAVEILRQAEVVSSPEDQMGMAIEKAALEDIKTAIDSCKTKRSKDSVTSMNVLVASISGEKVTETRCRKNLAKKLGLPVRRLSRGNRIRTTILKSEKSCWAYVCRKTRKDALSEETKRLAFNFWMKPGISHPTGNKADVKRERIGPKTYSSHQVYLVEKTQTELLNENDVYDENNVHVYDYISDIVDVTLCNKEDNVHKISCLKTDCGECGINKLELLPEETDDLDTAQIVKWERFEKVCT
ncbi:unnamed protein product [Mytilus coruscus]|uniref:Uncharacterized protein n=1 Tax=Mytilus coruscus TaxID=42192 RepID=A0A6J8DLQ4_MYTCO|nr:unnamed protein product [Mytilus coruscus]